MYKELFFAISEGIATITLNRPQVFHALNKTLLRELYQAFEQAQTDTSVRVIVLMSSGEKAFCSGADLSEFGEGTLDIRERMTSLYNPLISLMRNLPKPIICQLSGIAAGAGCSLALACDVIIASENAIMTEMFVGIGLVIDAGSSFFLPRAVGSFKAFELASTGRKIPANECLALGLVNQIVAPENLQTEVAILAKKYANGPTIAIGLIKKMLNQSMYSDLPKMLALETDYQEKASKTSDFVEGVTAFLEKRTPKFNGK